MWDCLPFGSCGSSSTKPLILYLQIIFRHSLTNSLTPCCLVDLIAVTLVFEVADSKLVEVFTVADVDDEDRVGLLQIWKRRFGHKVKLLFRL